MVAGGLLLTTTASILQAIAQAAGWANSDTGYGIWAVAAFVAWGYFRAVGGWMQHFITTRPASDKEIASGIRAARTVLARHEARASAFAPPAPPYVRLWHMGFLQIFGGFAVGFALLWAVGWCFPAFSGRVAAVAARRDVLGMKGEVRDMNVPA